MALGFPTFEVTAEDIARLNDEDLRTLVGLLCEAEVKSRGFPTSSVTWGGSQTAADGGLDVNVSLSSQTTIDGFVPCPLTGFQVKACEIPPSEIREEMKPEGKLRGSIRDLANRSGAYIIVSSKDSTTATMLAERRAAMVDAVRALPRAKSLTLDFYDRSRLATWVRNHEGVILWVREKVGRALPGWRPYGCWAHDPLGLKGEYLLDDKLRFLTRDGETKALDGMNRVRDLLRNPRAIMRLVGLSGVGKRDLCRPYLTSEWVKTAWRSPSPFTQTSQTGQNPSQWLSLPS